MKKFSLWDYSTLLSILCDLGISNILIGYRIKFGTKPLSLTPKDPFGLISVDSVVVKVQKFLKAFATDQLPPLLHITSVKAE